MRKVSVVWGAQGLSSSQSCPVAVIIDVLSFSTAVDAACSAGAVVYPFRWRDERAASFAKEQRARLAVQRQDASRGEPSLSPSSLIGLREGEKLVLPSPNGSTLSAGADANWIVAGCLRNSAAVADFILSHTHGDIALVAAGERWPDGSLRPALEDWLGAGAIASTLQQLLLSPGAKAAVAAFREAEPALSGRLRACASGQELIDKGFGGDVAFASALNASVCVPLIRSGRYECAALKTDFAS